MQNRLKAKLMRGEKTIGTMSQLSSQIAVECLGIAGLDFFIIDTEHAAIGPESMRSLIMASEKHPITALVRIPVITRDTVIKALDSGAGGLIVPAVETAEQVRNLISFAKYPKDGVRGFSMIRTASYGYDEIAQNPDEYFRHFNEETLVIPQCETLGCLNNIEEIVAISGVDGIFIGPYDLSTALGHPADFENQEFRSALQRILSVCRSHSKFVFMLSGSVEQTRTLFDEGFSGVVFSMDINILIDTYRSAVDVLSAEKTISHIRHATEASAVEHGENPFAEYLAQLD